jgi:hypothetical protein
MNIAKTPFMPEHVVIITLAVPHLFIREQGMLPVVILTIAVAQKYIKDKKTCLL